MVLAAFLIVGTPFAFFAWTELSQLLEGRVRVRGVLVMVAAMAILFAVVRTLRAYVQRLAPDQESEP